MRSSRDRRLMSTEGGNNGNINNNNNIGSNSSRSNNNNGGNFVTRSWARISGRRRKQQQQHSRPPPIEEGVEVTEEPIPSTSSSQQIPWKLANNEEKPKPFLNRGMDKLRRSIRKSFRKAPGLGSSTAAAATASSSSNGIVIDNGISSASPWEADSKNVRAGICKFNVKYLGSCEVYESRGVHVCEGALTHLKTRKKPTKAILYISGDGLRVVDRESNRGLIVDQTIEKVSFCAPDRHCDKGFAYICREGASRRWMCHGFLTTKESGERVSHAVGCAFTICLESKKKREAEQAGKSGASVATATTLSEISKTQPATSVTSKDSDLNAVWNNPPPEPVATSTGISEFAKHNPAYASFRRQLSISDRKLDPQTAIVNDPLPSASMKAVVNESTVKPRPVANLSLFDRQGSFRGPTVPQQAFKRFNSLRADLLSKPALDSTRLLNTEPIYEGDEPWPESHGTSNSIINTLPVSTSLQFNHIAEGNKENGAESPSWNGIFNHGCQSTPLHSARQTSNQAPLNHSKAADEWLEKTFKSLSFQQNDPHHAIFPQSQSFDFLQSPSGPPPSQPPPPLPSTRPVCEQLPLTSGPIPQTLPHNNSIHPSPPNTVFPAPSTISTGTQATAAINNTVSFDATDSIKTHARKGSSTRKNIEYQLLEEENAPVSPARNTPVSVDAFGLPIFVAPPPPSNSNVIRSGPSLSDPFDIQWSADVLKNVSTSNGGTPQHPPPAAVSNPFTSESAPVNV